MKEIKFYKTNDPYGFLNNFYSSYFILYGKSWENVEGYRYIIQPRFFPYKNSSFFIAGEFRNKKISFTNTKTFINNNTLDTLRNYRYPQELNYFGGAFIIGQKYFLNRRKSFFLEVTAGIGGRKRNPKLKNIPSGYEIQQRLPSKGFSFRTDYEKSGSSYVFPLGFRLLWRLNREPKINEFYRPLLQR